MTIRIIQLAVKQKVLFGICALFFSAAIHGQFLNKEVIAKISVEKGSEFYTFKATAENKTYIDYGLRYEYSLFVTDENGEVSKSSQDNRFFIKANSKKILNTLTLNYSLDQKCIILLVIYDKENKPIGKDRLVLENGGKTRIEDSNSLAAAVSQDEARPQDGFVSGGFISKKLITKSGKDFFRYFYADFYNSAIVTDKNISIKETFGRGRNTRIEVRVEDQIIVQFFTQPRKEFLVAVAKQTLARVIKQIQLLERQREQLIRY